MSEDRKCKICGKVPGDVTACPVCTFRTEWDDAKKIAHFEIACSRLELYELQIANQTKTIQQFRAEAESLLKAVAKMSNRRCHACGYVAYYLDATIPNCLCEQCGSADTRLIKLETQRR